MDSSPPTINRLYISFSENGCERSLARIDQNSIGRLVIALNKGKFYRPNHEIAQVDGSIKLTKYTIQPSADSIDGNQIHFTSLTTSQDVHGYHFTEAIKKYNRFAPIFICRSSNLSNAIDVKDISSKPHFSIGKCDTQHFTLFFGMFVGSNTNVFDPSERIQNMNFKQINFRVQTHNQ